MGKKMLVVLMGLCFLAMVPAFALAGADDEMPGKDYFDERFNGLERSVVEVKGDTSQIVSILGNVFEGTVPKGGNITRLCNEKGWNMIVLMGHNGIANPNKVAAGACFTYPQTAEEFQLALKKGKPLYDAWLKTQSTTFRVNRIKVDTAEIDQLNVRVANFKEKLAIKDMEVDQLKVRIVEITEQLNIKQANIDQLNVGQANFKQVNIDQLRIKQLEIDNLADLLRQAQVRCRKLEAQPPKTVVKRVPVPVTPMHNFVSDNDCGEPYFPKSWEKPIIRKLVAEEKIPVYWYVNLQPCTSTDEGGWLKVKVDHFDEDTRTSYTVYCARYIESPEAACGILREAGFDVGPGFKVRDGGKYKTVLVGEVYNWPAGMVCKR